MTTDTGDPAFDPDPAAVKEALNRLLQKHANEARVTRLPERLSGGLDTYIYGVVFAGGLPPGWPGRAVLRIYPVAGQGAKMEREFAVQRFLARAGLPAPRPLLADPSAAPWGLPIMLMERATGTSALDAFKNPLRIRRTIRAMAAIQARLHALPVGGCPLRYDRPLVDRLLEEPRSLLTRYPDSAALDALEWLDANAVTVRNETPVLLHNDFHPLNILADGEHMTLLDWSEAALGDHHCDVSRTLAVFWLAPDFENSLPGRVLLRALRRFIVRSYVADYRSHSPLESARLRYWGALHAFREWVKVEVVQRHGEEAIGARAGVAAEVPRHLVAALRDYFHLQAHG
jgi:aminoglycoside phosphotransferase (APT) family kinase protein